VNISGIILESDGNLRDVFVHVTNIQTPGYLFVEVTKITEINNLKFILSSSISNKQMKGNSEKPFFHSEGGSTTSPIKLVGCTFTCVSGTFTSFTYTLMEITNGVMVVINCMFIDMTVDTEGIINNAGVISVADASIIIKNSTFSNLQLDKNVMIYSSINTECTWGAFSVMVFNKSVVNMKDVLISNTYAGIAVHGGTTVLDNTNFTGVGSQLNVRYPSVERHIRCGMIV
jgi:hypothetical protein